MKAWWRRLVAWVWPSPDTRPCPRASVIILSHRKRFLPQCLASVLAQTIEDIEIRVVYSPRNWPTKLNDAVNAASAPFVAIVCDDDLLQPTFLEESLAVAKHGDIVYSDRYVFPDGSEPTYGTIHRYHRNRPVGEISQVGLSAGAFVFGSPLPMTCLIRKALWDRLHGYDIHLPHADTEFWFRAVATGARTVYIAKPLWSYREHPDQLSRTLESLTPALRDFHRKHYARFGVTISETPNQDGTFAGTFSGDVDELRKVFS